MFSNKIKYNITDKIHFVKLAMLGLRYFVCLLYIYDISPQLSFNANKKFLSKCLVMLYWLLGLHRTWAMSLLSFGRWQGAVIFWHELLPIMNVGSENKCYHFLTVWLFYILSCFTAVLWIRNDLFRIQLWISDIRIQAKVPDPTLVIEVYLEIVNKTT